MKSRPVKVEGHLFRYNFDRSEVEHIIKADDETVRFDEEWKNGHNGKSLYGIGRDGYMVVGVAGFSRTIWEDLELRFEYLRMWAEELDEEAAILADDFVKYELPLMEDETE